VLQAGGRGQTGNLLYFFPSEQPPLVLKVYCFRRSRWREFWKDVSERVCCNPVRHREAYSGSMGARRL